MLAAYPYAVGDLVRELRWSRMPCTLSKILIFLSHFVFSLKNFCYMESIFGFGKTFPTRAANDFRRRISPSCGA